MSDEAVELPDLVLVLIVRLGHRQHVMPVVRFEAPMTQTEINLLNNSFELPISGTGNRLFRAGFQLSGPDSSFLGKIPAFRARF